MELDIATECLGSSDAGIGQAFDTSTPYHVPQPGESAMDDLLVRKLGNRGWGRFHYFKNWYSSPWGEANNKPMSPKATMALQRFLEVADFPEGVVPSLFITQEGFLELAWEDADGSKFQLEFGSQETEVYLEAKDLETMLPNTDMENIRSLACPS